MLPNGAFLFSARGTKCKDNTVLTKAIIKTNYNFLERKSNILLYCDRINYYKKLTGNLFIINQTEEIERNDDL